MFRCYTLLLHLQVQHSLMVLRDQMGVAKAGRPAACCRSSCAAALEALARLAWSDDEVREMVAASGVQGHCI